MSDITIVWVSGQCNALQGITSSKPSKMRYPSVKNWRKMSRTKKCFRASRIATCMLCRAPMMSRVRQKCPKWWKSSYPVGFLFSGQNPAQSNFWKWWGPTRNGVWLFFPMKNAAFLAKILFFLCYAHITHFFGLWQTCLNGIITSPCPEVTLDTFGFIVRARLAARQVVFWRLSPKMALFGAKNGIFDPSGCPCAQRVTSIKQPIWCPS